MASEENSRCHFQREYLSFLLIIVLFNFDMQIVIPFLLIWFYARYALFNNTNSDFTLNSIL